MNFIETGFVFLSILLFLFIIIGMKKQVRPKGFMKWFILITIIWCIFSVFLKKPKSYDMKKNKLKITLNAIGKGTRLSYLEKHPHGYAAVTKVHKSKKTYSRKNLKNF